MISVLHEVTLFIIISMTILPNEFLIDSAK